MVTVLGDGPAQGFTARLARVAAEGDLIIAVQGDPGTGRSHTLARIAEAAGLLGLRVAEVRAAPADADLPYALLDAIGEALDAKLSLTTRTQPEDLAEATTIPRGRSRAKPAESSGVVVKGASDVMVKLARCCTPVPGDEIIGFVTKAAGVSVHRRDCTNADSLLAQPERLVEVEWEPNAQSTFLVQIMVEALDRPRLLSDITMALSDAHVNILSANLSTTRDRVAKSQFTFEMAETKHLDQVLGAVLQVPGVFDAYRVTS